MIKANRNDVTQRLPLIDALPAVRGRVGRPIRKPGPVIAERGYDHDKCRMGLSCRGVATRTARRGTPHGSGLGRWRRVVERTLSRLHQMKRLRTGWERTAKMH